MPVVRADFSRNIFTASQYMRWGVDDLYPQRCIEMVDACPQLEMAVDARAMFIAGQGIENEALGSTIMNFRGQSLNDCIRASARDCQEIPVIALHVRYNGMLQVSEITPVPVERFRVKEADDKGFVGKVFLAKKMNSFHHSRRRSNKLLEYDVFNPDPSAVLSQIEAAGGISKWRGQIAYAFVGAKPGARTYPKVWFHSAFDSLETIVSANRSIKRDTQRGFSMRTKVTKYGYFNPPTQEEKTDAVNEYKDFVGDDGAQVLIELVGNREGKTDFDPFQTSELDKVYAFAKQTSAEDVLDLAKIPRILYGQSVAGKLGTREEFEQAVNYVSSCVVDRIQRQIEELYSRVLKSHENPAFSNPIRIQNLGIENIMPTKQQKLPSGQQPIPAL